jgi:Fic family protein
MLEYIWQRDDWPQLRWNAERLLVPLGAARHRHGELLGEMSRVAPADRQLARLETLTDEGVKTFEIEGETLDRVAVRSSVARRLRLPDGAAHSSDARAEGTAEVLLDATTRYDVVLTAERLHRWHSLLFPPTFRPPRAVAIGKYRDDAQGPMQVVSGRIGRPTVHFEAPPAERLEAEMEAFFRWFNGPREEDGLIRSALAHLWFVTIHPFDDGNGRIARAIGELALAQDEQSSERFYSLSRQIERERNAYYDALEYAQKGNLDVTRWLAWFLGCYGRAIDSSRLVLNDIIKATRFWDAAKDVEISPRQRHVLKRVLRGFQGNLTVKKWASFSKTSDDTALRDINDLIQKRVLARNPGGSKNTSYRLAR